MVWSHQSYRSVCGSHQKGQPHEDSDSLLGGGIGTEAFHEGGLVMELHKCSWQLGFFFFPTSRYFICNCLHRKGVFSYYRRTDRNTYHILFGDVPIEFPTIFSLSVVQQQGQEDPNHKPHWYGSLICLDSAFILADVSESFLQFSAFCC